MKKVECIIRTACLDRMINALEALDITGLNITQVVGYGSQRGSLETELYRGVEYVVKLKEKFKIELVVADALVESVVNTIVTTARTDQIGDGKIFI